MLIKYVVFNLKKNSEYTHGLFVAWFSRGDKGATTSAF